MPDREKVIKGLEEVQAWLKHLQTVGYHGDIPEYRERELTVSDAIALLKEPDAVKSVERDEQIRMEYDCGVCGYLIGFTSKIRDDLRYKSKYCPECGRKVKWE